EVAAPEPWEEEKAGSEHQQPAAAETKSCHSAVRCRFPFRAGYQLAPGGLVRSQRDVQHLAIRRDQVSRRHGTRLVVLGDAMALVPQHRQLEAEGGDELVAALASLVDAHGQD